MTKSALRIYLVFCNSYIILRNGITIVAILTTKVMRLVTRKTVTAEAMALDFSTPCSVMSHEWQDIRSYSVSRQWQDVVIVYLGSGRM